MSRGVPPLPATPSLRPASIRVQDEKLELLLGGWTA